MANELKIFIPTGIGATNQVVWVHNIDPTIPIYIDWGDGTPVIAYNGQYISHIYTTPGVYSVFMFNQDIWGDDLGDGILANISGDDPFILIQSGDITLVDAFAISDYKIYSPTALNNGFLTLSLPFTNADIGSNEFATVDNVNAVINKLDTNTEYLLAQTVVIDSTVHNTFVGWLSGGSELTNFWNIDIFGFDANFNNLSAPSGFVNIVDIKARDINTNRYIYMIESNSIKILDGFSAFATVLAQASAIGFNEPFVSLSAVAVNSIGDIYLLDDNLLYKTQYNAVSRTVDLASRIGGTGTQPDHYLFNGASDVTIDNTDRVVVADANNLCIKIYNRNLVWISTFTSVYFSNTNRPIKVCADINGGNINVLTSGNELLMFNSTFNIINRVILSTISNSVILINILATQNIKKLFSDNQDNYLYIVTDSATIKLTRRGRLINKIENPVALYFTNLQSGCMDATNQIYIAKSDRVYKLSDPIVSISLKRDTEVPISLSAIMVNETGHEFIQDWVYNKSLKKLLRNLVILNGSINQKIVVSFDLDGSLRSFYTRPLETDEKAVINITLDNYVNVNEFVMSDVINRTLNAILQNQLDVLDVITPNVVFIPSSTTYPILP